MQCHQILILRFHLVFVSGTKSGKQTTLSFKPVQKRNPWSSDETESESDIELILEEVATREKRERKGENHHECLLYFSPWSDGQGEE